MVSLLPSFLLFPTGFGLGWIWNDVDSSGPMVGCLIEHRPIVDIGDSLLWSCSICVSLFGTSVRCLKGSRCSLGRCWIDSGKEESLEKGSWRWVWRESELEESLEKGSWRWTWSPQDWSLWKLPLVAGSILVRSLVKGEEKLLERLGPL